MIERRAFNWTGRLFSLRQDLSKTDIAAQLFTFFTLVSSGKGAHGEPTLLLLTLQNSARKLPSSGVTVNPERALTAMLKIVIMSKTDIAAQLLTFYL